MPRESSDALLRVRAKHLDATAAGHSNEPTVSGKPRDPRSFDEDFSGKSETTEAHMVKVKPSTESDHDKVARWVQVHAEWPLSIVGENNCIEAFMQTIVPESDALVLLTTCYQQRLARARRHICNCARVKTYLEICELA
jgi:hypothetical protein